MSVLHQALVFLAATVVAVPLFKRFGLGTVLGYLAAGVAIGPWGLKLISQVESVLHFGEIGVVLLMFLIGLELQPSRLWELRRTVFGLGSLQVVVTAALLAGAALGLSVGLRPAIIAGIGLSLSSTAFALQLLNEKNELATGYGRVAFGILLFQDLAVIPVLALLPLLGASTGPAKPGWLTATEIVVVIAVVIVIGRYLVRPLFRLVASTHSQELFTATALMLVLGTALAVSHVGMSMALGAFLAGVLLADSQYRHELEADIEPFKGLLLGLFFIAVGMSVNLGVVVARPLLVLALVIVLVLVKGAVLFAIGKLTGKNPDESISLGIVISQGGEFAFVLFSLAVSLKLMDRGTADLLVAVVSMSMATTPALFVLHERVLRPALRRRGDKRPFDVAPEEDAPVIIAGFGRVGQVVGRVLRAKHVAFTAMDSSAEHIDFIRRFGNKVFYGDAGRLELLRAARADKARVFVLAIDDVEASMRTVETVREHFPHLTIIARSRNRQHTYRLLNLGVRHVFRETFAASLDLTADVLESVGYTSEDAREAVQRFRAHDEQMVQESYPVYRDEKKLVEIAMRARAELESIFDKDEAERNGSAKAS
jgi:glutathione-regulated potassium-efflux system protein KefB